MQAMINFIGMRECTTRSRCNPAPLVSAVGALFIAGSIAVAQEAAFGTLVLQSPVQAVATINGEGTFLLVPGQDLRWSRIRPGNYRIDVCSGGEQWQREVQVQPGRTETLVAALSSAGNPLAAGAPPPVMSPAPSPAYMPPAPARTPDPVPAAATLSTPSETVTQQRKEDAEDREAQRRREQELLRQQREDRAAQQREREAEARALREQQRQEEEAKSQKKRIRPRMH